MKEILDMTCGGRMIWYQPQNPNVEFVDNRKGTYNLGTYHTRGGSKPRSLTIEPTTQADFTKLPFPDNSFYLVIFDPPHLKYAGKSSWLAKKYGTLPKSWPALIEKGFDEAMRVLKPNGTLIFKWSDEQIPVQKILRVIKFQPLLGDRRGKTRWLVFYKFQNGEEQNVTQ